MKINRTVTTCILLTLMALLLSCGASRLARTDSALQNRLDAETAKYEKNGKHIYRLTSKPIGREGFYYLIGNDGRVKVHPVKSLEGLSLRRFPFFKKMTSSKKGCTILRASQKNMVIFFRQTVEGEILCLSVPEEEIEGDLLKCSEMGN